MEEKTKADRTLSQIELELIAELAESGSDNARSLFLEWQNLKMKKLESVISKLEHKCNYCGKTEPCEGEYPEGCFYSDQASEPTPQRKSVEEAVEAAEAQADEMEYTTQYAHDGFQQGFKAGAQWQSQQHPPQVCPNCKQAHSETDCNGYCTAWCLQESSGSIDTGFSQPFNPWLKHLPTDSEVEEWYSNNINNNATPSSSIYKFRLWLKERYESRS